MNDGENRRNLLGEKEFEPEPVTAEEREELLSLTEQLAQPEISLESRLEIVIRMRLVLGKKRQTSPIENGRMLWDIPPPSSVSVG